MFQLAKRIRKYNGMQIVITQNIKDFVGSEELARKSTAIINACQYSFIFALAPNDMQDLVTLYEKAGGINESEQEQIVQAPRGQAFVIMSPTSRSSFTVDTPGSIAEMFEEKDYQTHYFNGEQGRQYWDDFVGSSRQVHMMNAPAARLGEMEEFEEQPEPVSSGTGVSFHVFDEDEYEAMQAENEKESSVTFHIGGDDEEGRDTSAEKTAAGIAADSALNMPQGQMAVFSQIASALGRMADAAEGSSVIPVERVPADYTPLTENYDSVYADLERRLREKEEELRRLQQEKDEEIRRLKSGIAQPEEEAAEYIQPTEEESEDGTDEAEDGDLFSLFGSSFSDEEEDDEDEFTEPGLEGSYDEETEEEPEEEEEPESAEPEEDEDEDEEDDDDFMSSFCSFAARLKSMSPFERLRANGQEVAQVTLEDLKEEIIAQRERRRSERR